MRLRRQLILVSLLTLSLPWAGCQYIREMEGALRQGQLVSLLASAQAVAARLSHEQSLSDRLTIYQANASGHAVYLHPLPAAAIIDGYDDDWRDLGFKAPQLSSLQPDFSTHYRAGIYGDFVYLFFRVSDPVVTYHNPGRALVASGDHVLLHLSGAGSEQYFLRTSAPGRVTARYLNSGSYIRQEHSILGAWRELGDGYQLELRIPKRLVGSRFGFSIVNQDEGQPSHQISTLDEDGLPALYITPQSSLTDAINVFASDELRLRVSTAEQWLIAQAGYLKHSETSFAISNSTSSTSTHEPSSSKTNSETLDTDTLDESSQNESMEQDQQQLVLAWIYRLALGKQSFPSLDHPTQTGHFDASEVQRALKGQAATQWYQDGIHRVGRAAVPIWIENIDSATGGKDIIGAVIAEQSTDAILTRTNAAFNRLFFYTVFATGAVGLVLLAYASWLSWRIRRLSVAADNAIGEDGQILGNFPDSRAKDEVGDLTRSYGQLLNRLKEYTDYLKTLSNKLSHELRTPLAVVRTSLDNLEHENLPAQANTYISRAREGASRLSAILTAMNAASRVEESIKGAEIEVFPMEQLLTDVTAAYRDIYPKQRLELEIEPNSGNFQVQGSPELIVQMLDKLVDNAADFCSESGSIRLFLARDTNGVKLQVSNDGPLLPAQMQGQLFDSLVSIRSNRGEKAHLGLGLHIVRLIVEWHQGRVQARNRDDGSGVIFEITLPNTAAG